AVALAAGAGAAVGLALPVHPVLGAAIAVVIYAAILKLLRRFPPEVREVLGGVLASRRPA
ncbi:MAG TPA: hypothetical protein VK761_06025, partial [Solirubrobacteraceae bacterium]|nr:hypothetical protein [Solirubrobacteraceae bacterium]